MLKRFTSHYSRVNVEFFILVLVVLIGILFDVLYASNMFIQTLENYPWGDALSYYIMSFHPFNPQIVEPPFVYRVLTPFLVYMLPLNHFLGFILINLYSLFFTALLFYYYLKKLGFNILISILGVVFLLLSPLTLYNISNFCLVDCLSFLFFLAAFYSILTRNNKLYFIILLVGVLNKETILLTIPLYFIYQLNYRKTIDSLKSTIIITTPALIIYTSIRYYFGLFKDQIYLKLFPYLDYNNYYYLIIFSFLNLFDFFISFGILWLFSLVVLLRKEIINKFLGASLWLIPLMALQMIFATDNFRMAFITFPIIIPLSLYIFTRKLSFKLYVFLVLSSFFSLVLQNLAGKPILLVNLTFFIILVLTTLFLSQKLKIN